MKEKTQELVSGMFGFDISEIPHEKNHNVVKFNGIESKIYIAIAPAKNDIEQADCDFALLRSNEDIKIWFWARKEVWKKYLLNKGNHPIHSMKTKDCKGVNIDYYEDKEDKENKENFVRKIKEDLGIDMLLDQLTELITKADAKQIICHGAPGTGKTYTIMEKLAKELNKDKDEGNPKYIFNNMTEGQEKLPQNFVQFHPSYDYTDFIEGLRPVCLESNEQPTFVRMDGIFKRFCRYVAKRTDKDKQYIFVIDEINRADLSKVFGELMYGLEEGNRGKPFSTQYDNLPCYYKTDNNEIMRFKNKAGIDISTENGDNQSKGNPENEKDIFEDGFYIPENVIIIGTMNDIDKSVESFDFAMQRRFCWVEVDANMEMQPSVLKDMFMKSWDTKGDTEELRKLEEKELEELADNLHKHARLLNEEIYKPDVLGKDYMIGHAYYKKFALFYKDSKPKRQEENHKFDNGAFENALKKVWKYSLLQILTSYFRGKKGGETVIKHLRYIFINGENNEQDKKQAKDQSSAN